MSRINEFLSRIDLEGAREYCMANGKTVRYAKGDCFVEAGSIGRYISAASGKNWANTHWHKLCFTPKSHFLTNFAE